MSKLEENIINKLINNNIELESQKVIPIDNCPWKNSNKISSKCDIYLPQADLYIEVKGFMTIFAMAKMSWFCKQNINYYIFQGTEEDWSLNIGNIIDENYKSENIRPKYKLFEYNFEYQIKEIVAINKSKENVSKISLLRLKDFIKKRIEEYIKVNGEWY
jgi:hypothetical protein